MFYYTTIDDNLYFMSEYHFLLLECSISTQTVALLFGLTLCRLNVLLILVKSVHYLVHVQVSFFNSFCLIIITSTVF